MGDLHTKSSRDVCSQAEVVTPRVRDVPRSGEGPQRKGPSFEYRQRRVC